MGRVGLCRIHQTRRALSDLYLTSTGECECKPDRECKLPEREGPAEPAWQSPPALLRAAAKVKLGSCKPTTTSSIDRIPRGSVAIALRRAAKNAEVVEESGASSSSRKRTREPDQDYQEAAPTELVHHGVQESSAVLKPATGLPYQITIFSKAEWKKAVQFLGSFGSMLLLEVDCFWSQEALGAWKHCGRHSLIRQVCRQSSHLAGLQDSVVSFLMDAKEKGVLNPGVGFRCKDGLHMSVAVAEEVASILHQKGFQVSLIHVSQQRWRRVCRDDSCGMCPINFDVVNSPC